MSVLLQGNILLRDLSKFPREENSLSQRRQRRCFLSQDFLLLDNGCFRAVFLRMFKVQEEINSVTEEIGLHKNKHAQTRYEQTKISAEAKLGFLVYFICFCPFGRGQGERWGREKGVQESRLFSLHKSPSPLVSCLARFTLSSIPTFTPSQQATIF